ncbi:MAG: acetyl-CoA C-acyltransferase [Burkholderiaceae bacterium]|nr:acetyl-CoA C-acyltransferase [Burkholderiaceae bacterium]
MREVVIVEAGRTPVGRFRGGLSDVRADHLGALVLGELVRRSGIPPESIDDVVFGCVTQVGEQCGNVARTALLSAGWPDSIPGMTVDRKCGSAEAAVHVACAQIASGVSEIVVAGGVESMSQFGLGADGGGQDGGNPKLRERVFQVPQGISADLIATLEGFGREELDAWALRSQRRAALAIEEARFTSSLVPVHDPLTGDLLLASDEFPRPDSTAQGLAALPASFVALGGATAGANGETFDQIALAAYPQAGVIRHIHTAGNSSGIVDGAAAVAVASGDYVKAHGLRPRARIRAIASIGSEPLIMLTAPAAASEKALKAAGLAAGDIDLWEINEAFAAVVLQTVRRLGIDPERVNVNGGSIALGHPLGATGAILLGTVLDELERRDASTAVITMCIGGGQGVATVIERV